MSGSRYLEKSCYILVPAQTSGDLPIVLDLKRTSDAVRLSLERRHSRIIANCRACQLRKTASSQEGTGECNPRGQEPDRFWFRCDCGRGRKGRCYFREIRRIYSLFRYDEVFVIKKKAASKDQEILLVILKIAGPRSRGSEYVLTTTVQTAYCRSSIRESTIIAEVKR
jgi:hypothetical protein